jgi:hypothetical protein
MTQPTTQTSAPVPLTPVSSGYAEVNGIKLYHEVYELCPTTDKYLADPLTNPPAGAVAASQASGDDAKGEAGAGPESSVVYDSEAKPRGLRWLLSVSRPTLAVRFP